MQSSSTPNNPDDETTSVIIVGGGLAGLACRDATPERQHSVRFVGIFGWFRRPSANGCGEWIHVRPRIAIYLSSYEECNRIFDLDDLDLRRFYAGADVRFENRFYRVADPFRHTADALPSLLPEHKIDSPLDKVLVGLVRLQTVFLRVKPLQRESEKTIEERLSEFGFSDEMVDRFFRPFLGGTLSLQSTLDDRFEILSILSFSRWLWARIVCPQKGLGPWQSNWSGN